MREELAKFIGGAIFVILVVTFLKLGLSSL